MASSILNPYAAVFVPGKQFQSFADKVQAARDYGVPPGRKWTEKELEAFWLHQNNKIRGKQVNYFKKASGETVAANIGVNSRQAAYIANNNTRKDYGIPPGRPWTEKELEAYWMRKKIEVQAKQIEQCSKAQNKVLAARQSVYLKEAVNPVEIKPRKDYGIPPGRPWTEKELQAYWMRKNDGTKAKQIRQHEPVVELIPANKQPVSHVSKQEYTIPAATAETTSEGKRRRKRGCRGGQRRKPSS